MNPLASRAPQRSLAEACRLAGLPEPNTCAEIRNTYWQLFLRGIDHEGVGTPWWRNIMMRNAPPGRHPGTRVDPAADTGA